LPAEVDVSAVTLQYVYRGADTQHLLYEKELPGQLYLKAPVIEFLDKELVRDGYSIAYRVTSQNAARERYLELCFYEAIQDIDIVKDRVPIGGIQYLLIPMDSSFTEIDLSATLRLKGAYGGNERVVSASHIYQNQPELLHRVAYDLQYDSISFNFTYFAPPGSYVLITDQLTSTTVQATDSHHVSAGAGAYHFTYQLTSPAGEPLGEAHEVRYQTPDSTPLFEMLHVNPGNILQTWNEDGTVNLYADTNFFCEDPNVFYEIEYVGERTYTRRSRDPLAKIERLPDQPYAIIYRVFYVVDGIEYLTYTVAPSGTTGTSLQVEFDATGTIYGAPALILGVQGKLHGPIELAVNGKPLALTEAELTQDGSFWYYCFDETVQTLYVKLSAEPTNDDIEYIKEKYGEDAISGNHFFTVEFELE
jgi:hypothetical protein